ncbi:hypothetical protein DW322_08095 [Rhodococcus rhodnii]|uniref:Uncharacterized protein n=2 Tax=Rhodococcus rhodnii TaxID=38312 RepID=R7WQP8_9NOCA|nr:hypothetical protein [Rhodococcus rhodnii]EOM77647.1 hypothetical protein Rrhod_1058 [Rhodococcus rhodnii LMG 5362]TXG90190.1 hypothetical protein DW322_08095 [Rhodococcus rhodnii]
MHAALDATISVDDDNRSTASLTIDGREFTAWTEANVPVDASGTPWVPTLRATALRKGLELRLDPPADPVALDGSLRAEEVLRGWYPDELLPTGTSDRSRAATQPERATGVGCFFSGGVDSFHTALEHIDEITHLVIVHGLDVSLDNAGLWEQVVARARSAAELLGKELIEVRSNIRYLHAAHGPHWQRQAHGAFLAHVALLLSQHIHTMYVPASDDESRLEPLGTHPDLDPLWSSSGVRIVHHGVEIDRVGKLAILAESDIAMNHLRVCWFNLAREFNCGRCEKCLRTMIGLRIVGAEGRCTTLPSTVDPKAVERMYLRAAGPGGERFARENLARLTERGDGDSELAHALDRALHRGRLADLAVTARFYGIDVGLGLLRYHTRKLTGRL